MSNAFERRYVRYIVPSRALHSSMKTRGLAGLLGRWRDCSIRDISLAGVRIETKERFSMSDAIQIKIEERGQDLLFNGVVVNASMGRDGLYEMGVSLELPESGSSEEQFMQGLSERFAEAR